MADGTRGSALGWTALAGAGLAAGLIALASAARPAGEATPAFRLMARLPGPVVLVAAGAATLAAAAALVVGLSRSRQPDLGEDEAEEPSRIPRWLRPILSLLALAPYVILAVYLARAGATLPDLLARLGFGLDPSSLGLPSGPDVEMTTSFLYSSLLATVLLVATLGTLALMLWILLGPRLADWWARPAAEAAPRGPVAVAVEESLEDLEREPDARVAIIRCYRRFERALAEAGAPRAPWLTPTEFMRQALGRLALPGPAVGALTGLFERSRFSDEPMGAPERGAALAALREIEAQLAAEAAGVAAA